MRDTVEYTKGKMRAYTKMPLDIFSNIKLKSGTTEDDYVMELLTHMLEAEYYWRISETQDTRFTMPKPKFLDWLFGRQKTIIKRIVVTDVLKKAPKSNSDIITMYSIEDIEPEE